MNVAVEVMVFLLGAASVAATLASAVRTVILPRGVRAKLSTTVFAVVRAAFDLRLRRAGSYEVRDRTMALYGPLALLSLAVTWLLIVLASCGAMFWALGAGSFRNAVAVSGSSLFTLGFSHPSDYPKLVLAFVEAGLGLSLAALLITYLPSLNASFSRRERTVTLLEVRAGSPPSGVEMIERYHRIHSFEDLNDVWPQWETWFVEVEETHTSAPALVFFRSPQPDHSWITAAGAVLDGASLFLSCVPQPQPRATLCVRAGYLALRRIADYFGIPFDQDPAPNDPITVDRDEFDAAYDRLAAAGVPLVPDRDQAWRDFRGWRVNYDTVLVTLAGFVVAPYAPWSSDRSPAFRPRVLRGRR